MSVVFDQLRIADDGRRMYISVHVNRAEYFDNIYLDSITIVTADRVYESCSGVPTSGYLYKRVFGENMKEADLVLEPTDFMKSWEQDAHNMMFKRSEMSSNLFFVFVKVKGIPGECTPCALDKEVTLGVTFDESVLYQKVMDYTKELADDCKTPSGFIDFILLWNAFKASIETEHFVPAIKYFNMLFGDGANSAATGSSNGKTIGYTYSKPCGCHG